MKAVAWLALLFAPAVGAQSSLDLGDARMALLDDPVRIVFQPGAASPPLDRVRQTIAIVAGGRGWQVVAEKDGRWELEREVREKHKVRVAFACEAGSCLIRYVDSENLLYQVRRASGSTLRVIHRNYNNWVRELALSLAGGLGVPYRITYGFAPVAAVEAVPFLDDAGRQAYREFLAGSKPRAFAIAPNGAWGVSGVVTPPSFFTANTYDPVGVAVSRCNERGGGSCRLYAVDDRVVWSEKP